MIDFSKYECKKSSLSSLFHQPDNKQNERIESHLNKKKEQRSIKINTVEQVKAPVTSHK